jgi:hypothetical protein
MCAIVSLHKPNTPQKIGSTNTTYPFLLFDTLWARHFLLYYVISYTVKKVIDFPVPSRDVTNQTLPGQE